MSIDDHPHLGGELLGDAADGLVAPVDATQLEHAVIEPVGNDGLEPALREHLAEGGPHRREAGGDGLHRRAKDQLRLDVCEENDAVRGERVAESGVGRVAEQLGREAGVERELRRLRLV